jgi:hypothetical protein
MRHFLNKCAKLFDIYKRLTELVSTFEWHPLALLDHYNERDLYFYRLAKLFCEQIQYPYKSPLVNAHSNEYFSSLPPTNMVSVPLCEDRHLLALPDFVHELGHIVHARIWRKFLAEFTPHLQRYIAEQKVSVANQASSNVYQDKFDLLEQVWTQRYVVEFFCDVFATYLVGPAYGWSHLRLVISSQSELYHPSFGEAETHPADEARMRIILAALEEMGDDTAAQAIKDKWKDFTSIIIDKPDGEYHFCYPDDILERLARQVIKESREIDLIPFFDQPKEEHNLPSLMLEAWEQFHNDPANYPDWEVNKVDALRSLLTKSRLQN